jgi:1-acyl-sn-glycerol-3-phosphate acyltransferase
MKAAFRAIVIGLARLLAGAHAHWEGCAPLPRQRIYFANHSSHLDTVVIVAALPADLRAITHPVAALDYWGGTKLRRAIAVDCLNAVLIDRSGNREADPLAPLEAVLHAGESLIIFPEGTRGQGDIAPFRSGLYHLAARFPDVELVPVYLENLHRVLPKGSMLLVPLICTSWFGAPLRLLPGEDRPTFLARARAAVLALSEARRPLRTPSPQPA